MTKASYMALADFQSLWTNDIKPYIVAGFIAMLAGTDANAKNLVLADGTNIAQATFIAATEKGANSGVATLGADGKVPSSQLPSFVDDVIDLLDIAETAPEHCSAGDKYYNSSSKKIFTATGTDTWGETGEDPEGGKIYITLDDEKTYRWSGTTMAEISAGLALGETQGTAYEGSKGKANADAITALQTDKANKSEMAINAVSGDDTKKEIVLKTGTSQEVVIAHQDISGKADKSEMSVTPGTDANADKTTIQLKSGTSATVLVSHQDISGKVDKVEGKGLSTNDYTDAEKTKLSGIETGAQVNVIETVKVNGTALTPDANKAVDIEMPERVTAAELATFVV